MQRVPHWLIASFVGVLAAAALGGRGANAFVALLAAVAAGLIALRALRDPPWTAVGRARWRWSFASWGALARALVAARRPWPSRPVDWPTPDAPPPHGAAPVPDVAPGARLPVRCEVVTERLQVWHSTLTHRAYEVPVDRGLADATPGMVADLVFERGRPRIVTRAMN